MSVRWFCFLRAINTGMRRVTNDELIAAMASFGLADVAAYQAAGNLTFVAEAGDLHRESVISERLSDALGFECPVFLRTAEELSELPASCPFDEPALAATEGRVQLTFLRHEPNAGSIDAAMALVPDDDRVEIRGREWWWLPTEGVSTSRLPVRQIEQLLGPMTMRTLATVERFVAKYPVG